MMKEAAVNMTIGNVGVGVLVQWVAARVVEGKVGLGMGADGGGRIWSKSPRLFGMACTIFHNITAIVPRERNGFTKH